MILFGYILALLLSFYLLARLCDEYFVPALDKISSDLKMSSDAAGATLMAVGSSAPELFVAIIAVLKPGDHGAIGMGNIVGSAIFNILVITGAVAMLKEAKLAWQAVVRDMTFYTLSIVLLMIVFLDGSIDIYEAVGFIFLYIIYVVAVIKWRKWIPYTDPNEGIVIEEEDDNEPESKIEKVMRPVNFILDKLFPSLKHYYWVFFIAILIIAALSWVLVESAVGISHILNIPEAIIALTVLAVGTSVPDMFSSLIVSKQGRGGMAVSNAVGSNIFDILIGLGLPFIIVIAVSGGSLAIKTDELTISILILFGSVIVLMFLMIINKWKIGKKMGIFLIALYLVYFVYAFMKI